MPPSIYLQIMPVNLASMPPGLIYSTLAGTSVIPLLSLFIRTNGVSPDRLSYNIINFCNFSALLARYKLYLHSYQNFFTTLAGGMHHASNRYYWQALVLKNRYMNMIWINSLSPIFLAFFNRRVDAGFFLYIA